MNNFQIEMPLDYTPHLKTFVFPGGTLPQRHSKLAAGYDIHARLIVHQKLKESNDPDTRLLLFDFENEPSEEQKQHLNGIIERDLQTGEYVYYIPPMSMCFVAIGFAMEMPFPLFYFIVSKSGLSIIKLVGINHSPSTIDADFRGEPGALIYNEGLEPFALRQNDRIAQIIFLYAVMPIFDQVESIEELSITTRGTNGLGSTGT